MAARTPRLRRMTDRVEDWTAWLLLATGMVVALVAVLTGMGIHDRMVDRGRAEALDRVPAVARLVEDAPSIPSEYATSSPVMVPATWSDRSGEQRAGLVSAAQGQAAGSTVGIWLDRSGAAVPAPTSGDDAVAGGVVSGVLVLGAGSVVLLGVWLLVRQLTLAVNRARWEREWREVAPIWIQGMR